MDTVWDLLINYWQFTIFGVLVLIGFLISIFDKGVDSNITFKTKGMPNMKPISIPTKGKGFFGGIKVWLFVTRKWEITKDFHYSIDGENFVIPKGFKFDGASVPKFLRSWLSPMGVLLIGGLVHDYGYKYETLLLKGRKSSNGVHNQKWMDITFRDINIEVNGFRTINYLAYWALRSGGFAAWNGHRKVNAQWDDE